jgi:hypothetical protein
MISDLESKRRRRLARLLGYFELLRRFLIEACMVIIIIRRYEDVPVLQGSKSNDLKEVAFLEWTRQQSILSGGLRQNIQISANRMRLKKGASGLCRRLRNLAATSLLCLEVLVKKVKSLLVGVGAASDGEHALSGLVMGSFGNADAGARGLADLADLTATTADDASDHIRGNGDVLGLNVFALFNGRRSKTASTNIWASIVRWRRGSGEVGTVASAVEAARSTITSTIGRTTSASTLDTDRGAVEDSAVAALLIIYKALADFPDSLLDAIRSTLDLDNALCGLGKHLLLRDHANAGTILDLLDLSTLTADDGAHLVVRDEEADGYEIVSTIATVLACIANSNLR